MQWDIQKKNNWLQRRRAQSYPTCNIVRYTVTAVGNPSIGKPETREQVSGLTSIPITWRQDTSFGVSEGKSMFEINDYIITAYTEIRKTDQIQFNGSLFEVIKILGRNTRSNRYTVLIREK